MRRKLKHLVQHVAYAVGWGASRLSCPQELSTEELASSLTTDIAACYRSSHTFVVSFGMASMSELVVNIVSAGQVGSNWRPVSGCQAAAQQVAIFQGASRQAREAYGYRQGVDWIRPVDASSWNLRATVPPRLRQSAHSRQVATSSRAITSSSLGWNGQSEDNEASRNLHGDQHEYPYSSLESRPLVRKEFFLLSYDYVDGILEKRMPHREAHLALTFLWQSRGALLLGGAFKDPVDGAAIVLLASNLQEVERDFVKCDPYFLNGLVSSYNIRPWTVLVGSALSPELNPPQISTSQGLTVAAPKVQLVGLASHANHPSAHSSPRNRPPGMPPTFHLHDTLAHGPGKIATGQAERCVSLEKGFTQTATNGSISHSSNGPSLPGNDGPHSHSKKGSIPSGNNGSGLNRANGLSGSSGGTSSHLHGEPSSSSNSKSNSISRDSGLQTGKGAGSSSNGRVSFPSKDESTFQSEQRQMSQTESCGKTTPGTEQPPLRITSLSGMTGFARKNGKEGKILWAWEARSVNGRSLEVRTKVPDAYVALQQVATSAAAERFARGTVSLNLTIQPENSQEEGQLSVNQEALEQIAKELAQLRERSSALGELPASSLDSLLRLPGVVQWVPVEESEEEKKAQLAAITKGLKDVLDELAASRRSEGVHLAEILNAQLEQIEYLVDESVSLAALRPEILREKVKAQVKELMEVEERLDPARLEQEVALLATRMDVREELERLKLHVAAAKKIIFTTEHLSVKVSTGKAFTKASPVGRSLDFLAQEFHREANTLCSKANDVSLTQAGLKLKGVIEQFKEQAANVE